MHKRELHGGSGPNLPGARKMLIWRGVRGAVCFPRMGDQPEESQEEHVRGKPLVTGASIPHHRYPKGSEWGQPGRQPRGCAAGEHRVEPQDPCEGSATAFRPQGSSPGRALAALPPRRRAQGDHDRDHRVGQVVIRLGGWWPAARRTESKSAFPSSYIVHSNSPTCVYASGRGKWATPAT